MKNKKTVMTVILIAVLTVNVYAQQGGRQINSADELKKYLDSQPTNGPNNPIKVTMSVNDRMIWDVASVISSAGKYVSLTLSGSFLTSIPRRAFQQNYSLVSITIPKSVTSIEADAFSGCTDLTSVTFEGTIPSSEMWGNAFGGINDYSGYIGDIVNKYLAGGPGTYKRSAGSGVWKREFTNDAASYYNRGFEYYKKQEYDKAIADYSQAIQLDPNATRYANRGAAYNNKGDYDKAIADFNQAISFDSRNETAYSNRAFAYNGKGDYDKAIADANQAIQLDPNFANPYRHRGYAYMKKGDYKQARADCNKSLQLDSSYQRAKDLDTELKKLGY